MTIAVERAEARASDQRANWAVKEAQSTEQCLTLKRELEAVQVELLTYLKYESLRHNIRHFRLLCSITCKKCKRNT